ncbi:MAG: DUF1836 domain-containing protein [Candidatus Faecousia sp.]|nr:DUF1836 domain-containing protein [Bacillota bacterium]MDY4754886.1 DUF1836 domain-containing protein [Candidatus Faecousia sp.]MDY6159730.1 DUF1836 domain-containing protein [Candidatus Faecousia sp.]
MNEEYRRQLAEYVAEFHLPRYRELPDIGLHLEQVTRYASRYVPSQLTGSMVSNYVKQKLIPGPVKKSYYQESIAYLIFLSYIKAVMPLEDIRLMMEVQKSSYELQVAYDYFCDELENLLQYVCGLRETPAVVGSTRSQEKELLRTALLSITYKIYLDQYLSLIRAEKNS